MTYSKEESQIHDEMLASISNKQDKSTGSFIYDATKPMAIALGEIYDLTDAIEKKFSVSNLSGAELEQRIYEQTGLKRKDATKATGTLKVIGQGQITKGDLFHSTNGVYFAATNTVIIKGQSHIAIEATVLGAMGNMPANTIVEMGTTIQGITKVVNETSTVGGYEAESDQALLQRFFEKRRSPATSGNSAQYRIWAKEVLGVGDAKVIPLWSGDNTVKVVIADTNMQPANAQLIDRVQQHIDPSSKGLGEGMAPIGAKCTVASADGVTIKISFSMQLNSGTKENATELINDAISRYFKSIAFTGSKVYHAKIGATLLGIEQVLNIADLRINDKREDITLGEYQVPVIGGIVIEE